jgi:hypothetical protein
MKSVQITTRKAISLTPYYNIPAISGLVIGLKASGWGFWRFETHNFLSLSLSMSLSWESLIQHFQSVAFRKLRLDVNQTPGASVGKALRKSTWVRHAVQIAQSLSKSALRKDLE